VTLSRIGGRCHLSPQQVRTQAPAYSDLAYRTAARSRWLWEMAHGTSAIQGEPPIADTNPQGTVGWDRSGPPFGQVPVVPFFVAHGHRAAASGIRDRGALVGAELTSPLTVRATFWVRPFAQLPDPWQSPNSRGFLLARLVGSGSISTRLAGRSLSLGTDEQGANVSVTTTRTGFAPTWWIDLRPGWNTVQVRITPLSSGTVDCISLALVPRARLAFVP